MKLQLSNQESEVCIVQTPFVVRAAGATKKVQKTVQKKVQGAGKKAAKNVKKNLPNKPGKAVKKAVRSGGGGADSWYGPDRALFLGELPLVLKDSVTLFINVMHIMLKGLQVEDVFWRA